MNRWWALTLTLNNKFQWNINRNKYILVQEKAFENVVYEITTVLSRRQCVNSLRPSDAYMRQWTNHHWLVHWMAPSHYLKQCQIIVNWTLSNKLQCNFNRKSNIFIQENALEHVVCEMASILFRLQCVNMPHINFTVFHVVGRLQILYPGY